MENNFLKPFDFYCQKILPLVYDDSLSYYEVLCKIQKILNEIITKHNELTEYFSNFQKYVNQEVERITKQQLQEWKEDGTLESLINIDLFNNFKQQVQNQFDALSGEINLKLADFETKLSQINTRGANVKDFGAKGDNLTDDTNAFFLATSFSPKIILPKGTYLIKNNLDLKSVDFRNNALINLGVNSTVSIDEVIAGESQVVFTGQGKIIINNNQYSLGWYDGNSLNEKWDFARKTFKKDNRKYVLVPIPNNNDKAIMRSVYMPNAWKVTAPLYFNDNENELIFDSRALLVADVLCDRIIDIGSLQKPEEIIFINGLQLEGSDTIGLPYANYGIVINGGARISFKGETKIKHFNRSGVVLSDRLFASDEITFDFLEVTGFKEHGLLIEGGVNGNINNKVNYLFTNGGYTGCKSLLQINGRTRAINFLKIAENLASFPSFGDFTESVISVKGQTVYTSRSLTISNVYCNATTKPIINISNNSNNYHENIAIENVNFNHNTKSIDISYVKGCVLQNIKEVNNSIFISDCENVIININPTNINGNCKGLLLNGSYYNKSVVNVNDVIILEYPLNIFNGVVDILTAEERQTNVIGILRGGGNFIDVFKGTLVDVTTGVLTGTTGVEGRLTVSYASGKLYIENRFTRNLTITTLMKG